MSVWQSIVHTPLAEALGRALFHFVWEAALIAGILAGALFVLRPSSARVRYGFSCLAMLAMLAAFGFTLAGYWPSNGVAAGVSVQAFRHATFSGTLPEPLSEGIDGYLPLAVPVWGLGVLLFYLHYVWSWFAVRRMRRVGTCAAPAHWQERLDKLAASRTVILLESCLAEAPVVIGYLRPVILLPLGLLTGLQPEQVEAILIHELAHIRRHDYLVNLLQSLVEGLLFYHPAVWWVSGLIRTERENCCDDVVIAAQCDAYEYATALAALQQSRSQAALAASGGSLAKRIRRLLRQQEGPRPVNAPVAFASVLLVSLAVAVSAWQPAPAPAPKPEPAAPVQQPAPAPAPKPQSSAYRKWLQEDVAYIVTNAERAEFKALQTDGERERFIEKFWLDRDPTPGTPRNEFKEEHYRRIGYANQRFAAGIAGWKTDRGRTYIVYGPPDEIESHHSPEGPWERWRYRWIEGVGSDITLTFTDPSSTGEYKLSQKTGELVKGSQPAYEAGIAAIQVNQDRTVSISLRVHAGAQPVHVRGEVANQNREVVHVFEELVRQREFCDKTVGPLAPGRYRLHIIIRAGATTEVDKSLDFLVK